MYPYNPMARQSYEQNLRNIIDQANGQLQQLQNQPVPTNLTQNFQIAPQTQNPNELQSAYAGNIEEVRNIFMQRNGIFVDKGLTTAWFKDTEGKVRTFTLSEIVEKDEKDIEIDNLRKEIDELKSLIPDKKTKKEEK